MSQFHGKHVLVTGATGFVGGSLARRLVTEGAHVTATGRNRGKLAELENAGAHARRAHLLDFGALRQMMEDQDVVFHVAAWLGPRHGPPEDAWALNVYASEQIARIAATMGVGRLVVVSSMAAYGPPDRPIMDETHALDTTQGAVYGRTKALGEQRVAIVADECALPAVIARPGIVYGPGSYGWSLRMVQFVRRGIPVVFGDGKGHAHPIFIENLIDGLLLTAVKEQAAGLAFNFVDRAVSWRQWFEYYGEMCGRKPRSMPLWPARLALLLAERLPLGLSVDRNLIAFYDNRSVYPIARARRVLDYQPRVDLQQGMAQTEAWLRQENAL
jgi:nucleoside-diphosphate-sugar epimerase